MSALGLFLNEIINHAANLLKYFDKLGLLTFFFINYFLNHLTDCNNLSKFYTVG